MIYLELVSVCLFFVLQCFAISSRIGALEREVEALRERIDKDGL